MADKHIEDKLRNRLANHQVMPESGAWENIQGSLPKAGIQLWKPVLTALLLLLLGGTGYIYYTNRLENTDQVLNNKHQITSNELNKEEQGKASKSAKPAENIASKVLREDAKTTREVASSQKERIGITKSKQTIFKKMKEQKVSTLPSEDVVVNYGPVQSLYLLNRLDYEQFKLPMNEISIPGFIQMEIKEPVVAKQEKEKKLLEDRKTTLYFQAMPILTYNRIEANQNDDEWISEVKKAPVLSADRIGIRLEMGMLYAINKRWEVFAGLLYFSRSQLFQYSVNNVDSLIGETKDNDISIVPTYSQETREYNYHLQNVGIQVGVNYLLKSNKFVTSFGSGVELHKSLRTSSDGIFNEPNLYVFYNLYYRIEYPKDKRFRLMAQPTFNYSLNIGQRTETPFYIKPYGLGLNFGFTFKL